MYNRKQWDQKSASSRSLPRLCSGNCRLLGRRLSQWKLEATILAPSLALKSKSSESWEGSRQNMKMHLRALSLAYQILLIRAFLRRPSILD